MIEANTQILDVGNIRIHGVVGKIVERERKWVLETLAEVEGHKVQWRTNYGPKRSNGHVDIH